MTPEEEKKIERWAQNNVNDIPIKVILSKDKRSEAFQSFINRLKHICPKIQTDLEQDEGSTVPGIQIGNIQYHAIPLDKELEPFLGIIGNREGCRKELPPAIHERLEQIDMPAWLKIYITPQCPFCPVAVKQLISLAAANKLINLVIIDGFLFREMAKKDNIHSAPTVLLDEQFRWSGSMQLQEIVDVVSNRDPSQLSAASLTSMIKEGNAVKVAEMMLNSGCIYPAFMELLVHEKWPIRLGAMVAFETVAAKRSQLVKQAIPFLWEKFSQVDDPVKGDILYLYGQTKDAQVVSKLESILVERYSDDVKEAAVEALEALKLN